MLSTNVVNIYSYLKLAKAFSNNKIDTHWERELTKVLIVNSAYTYLMSKLPSLIIQETQ